MNQSNKPNYPMPSYEGLYYLSINNDGTTSDGYVERLLPNGEYIVTYLDNTCERREVTIKEQTLEYRSEFFLTRNAMAAQRAAIREERYETEQAAINPDTGEII